MQGGMWDLSFLNNKGSDLFPPPYPWHWKDGVLDTEVPGFIFSESGECDREMQFIHVLCVSYRVPWDSCREAERIPSMTSPKF